MKMGKCEDSAADIWSVGVRISCLGDTFNGNTTYKYVALGCDLSRKKNGIIFSFL
jgi:hypothetical protein